jgi:hypothetical protein
MHKEKETWELDCGVSPSEEKALKKAATNSSLNGDATAHTAPVSNPDREPEP